MSIKSLRTDHGDSKLDQTEEAFWRREEVKRLQEFYEVQSLLLDEAWKQGSIGPKES